MICIDCWAWRETKQLKVSCLWQTEGRWVHRHMTTCTACEITVEKHVHTCLNLHPFSFPFAASPALMVTELFQGKVGLHLGEVTSLYFQFALLTSLDSGRKPDQHRIIKPFSSPLGYCAKHYTSAVLTLHHWHCRWQHVWMKLIDVRLQV